jgi:hypothetical protein
MCKWEALTEIVAPSALFSHQSSDCEQFYNVELQQQWSM